MNKLAALRRLFLARGESPILSARTGQRCAPAKPPDHKKTCPGLPVTAWLLFRLLNPPSKKLETSLALINRDDRMSSANKSITNEVKALWHKASSRTSTKEREAMEE
jgi:hypothetical protein